nr:hypothetical protein [Tanacetum cinerariifolium]
MLKPGEFEIWRIGIEQYIQMIDYSLWEIIENEDKAHRRLEVKARSTLMIGIPNEHQLKFNSIKDAKSLLEAIEKRFGGNDVTKKTQRNLLKQQYENFTASSSESLDQTFNRLQKLRNKPDLDSMSMDDLHNNLKIYEPEVKGVSSSSTNSQNMAFVSSFSNNNTNSNNEAINIAFRVTTAGTQVNAANSSNIDNLSDASICAFLASQSNSSQLVNKDLEQIHPDYLKDIDLKWQMAMLTIRAIRFLKNTGRKLNLNRNETVGFDKTKGRKSKRRNVPVKTTNFLALASCDRLGGYNWSHQAEEGPNYALMAYSASSSDSEASIDSNCSKNCLKTIETLKSQNEQLLKDLKKFELMVLELRKKLETIQREKDGIQLTVEKLNNASKSLNKLIDSQIVDNYKKGPGYNVVLPPHIGLFMPPKPDLSYIGLKEFTSEPTVETVNAKTSEEVLKPVVAGTQSNGNAGTKDNNNAGQARKEKEPGKEYIFLPLWTADSPFLQKLKSSQDAGFKPSNDVGKKFHEVPRQENECKDQEEKDGFNSANRVNTISSTVNAASNKLNDVGRKSSIELPDDPNMPELEDISIFEDLNEDVFGAEADLNNLETTFQVSPIPTIRIHKDNPLEQVIGDLHSAPQTRRMNKLDKRGIMIRNMARLVAQGHTQEEGIDYDALFALVVRIKAIRLFLAYSSFKDFMVYQMDVKSAFLYEKIEEEVYVCQPLGFKDPDFADKVSTKKELCNPFEKIMHEKLQISSMGKLTFFLGLFIQTFLDKQFDELPTHKEKYDVSFHTKKVFANMKRIGKGFSGMETSLLPTIVGPNQVQIGEGSAQPTNTQHTPTFDMLPFKPKKTQKPRQPKRKTTKVSQPSESTDIDADEAIHKERVIVCDEDRLEHIELMKIYTTLQNKVHNLEDELKRTKTAQQTKIDGLVRKVKKLEKKQRSRTYKLKRLYKVGLTAKVISSSDDKALDKEDTSKQGRIDEIDDDEDIALVSAHDYVSIQDNIVQDEGMEDVGKEEVVEVVSTAKMIIDVVVDAAQVTTAIAYSS